MSEAVIIGAGKIGTLTGSKLTNAKIAYHDPYKEIYVDNINSYPYAIVCVDTVQTGPNDYRDLDSVLSMLNDIEYSGIVVIRSTLSPTKVIDIDSQYNLEYILFPEFWPQRENALILDDSWMTILGGSPDSVSKVKDFLVNGGYFSDQSTFRGVSKLEAALIKLSSNSILATKVTMFNAISSVCEDFDSSYEIVKDALRLDKRLGADYHSTVPSPDDGLPGFGGHCLPKDIRAMAAIDKYGFFDMIDTVNKKLGR